MSRWSCLCSRLRSGLGSAGGGRRLSGAVFDFELLPGVVELEVVEDRHRAGLRQQRGNLGLARPIADAHRDDGRAIVEGQLTPLVDVWTTADAGDDAQQAADRAAPQQAAGARQKQAARAKGAD